MGVMFAELQKRFAAAPQLAEENPEEVAQ